MSRTVIVVQARMGSTRLPGKILKEVLKRPLLSFLIERLKTVSQADALIIATTINSQDDVIVTLCEKENVLYYRGSEEDVLSRYYEAAHFLKADTVVRITSDCPLMDPAIVDRVIQAHHGFDYTANTLVHTFPRGMDVEVFSFSSLAEANNEARMASEREHVTLFFKNHPERYRLGSVAYPTDESRYRLTVDTPEDFELVSKILESLYPSHPTFNLEDVLHLLKTHPHLSKINEHVKQKHV